MAQGRLEPTWFFRGSHGRQSRRRGLVKKLAPSQVPTGEGRQLPPAKAEFPMTTLDLNDRSICAEIQALPARFQVLIRFRRPEGTIEDGPLVNVAKMRHAFRTSFVLDQSLDYFQVAGWMHSFFWGMSEEQIAFMLGRIYGIAGVEPEAVRQSVRKLKLKGWSDFPDAYTSPPFVVKVFREEP
jgi:hypothetical protein